WVKRPSFPDTPSGLPPEMASTSLVPGVEFEPTRCTHTPLKRARLPIPPPGRLLSICRLDASNDHYIPAQRACQSSHRSSAASIACSASPTPGEEDARMQRLWKAAVWAVAVMLWLSSAALAQSPGSQTLETIRLSEVVRSVFYAPQYVALALGFFE